MKRETKEERAARIEREESDPTPVWLLDAGGGLYVNDAGIRGVTLTRIKSAFAMRREEMATDARDYIAKAHPKMYGSPLVLTVASLTLGQARKMAREERRGRR